jgi:hypothetical protein
VTPTHILWSESTLADNTNIWELDDFSCTSNALVFALFQGSFGKLLSIYGNFTLGRKNDNPKSDASPTGAKTVPKTHFWQCLLSLTTKTPGKGIILM